LAKSFHSPEGVLKFAENQERTACFDYAAGHMPAFILSRSIKYRPMVCEEWLHGKGQLKIGLHKTNRRKAISYQLISDMSTTRSDRTVRSGTDLRHWRLLSRNGHRE
jgi:hypothetical protein